MSTIALPAHRIAALSRPSTPLLVLPPSSSGVGAVGSRPMTTGERTASGIWAAAEGAFAYTLFKGITPFSTPHPVWGTLFALAAVSNLAWAAAGTTVDWDDEKKP